MSIQELLNEVEKVTKENFEKIKFNDTEDIEIVADALEILLNHYKQLEEKFMDYVKEVDENFKPITKEEQIYG